MNRYQAALVAVVLTTGVTAVGCSATASRHLIPQRSTGQHSAPADRPGTATPGPPVPAWNPPPAAVSVARRYTTAALSYVWNQPPGTWISQVAPFCTPQWEATLEQSADGGEGGQAVIVASGQTATAAVIAVYPSAGPGPAQRVEVTARVTVTAAAGLPQSQPAVLTIDLLAQPGGGWLVAWAA